MTDPMTDSPPAQTPLISYAQNFEDVILWRALKHIEGGFYIDVGAQDPLEDSVSLGFYEKGWRGVHIEPTLHYAKKLREARPDETVIQAAIAAEAGVLHFYEITETGLSTGDAAQAAQHRGAGFTVQETDVPAIPLGALLDRYAERPIHWLKIDVEGFEQQVIESWGASPVRPWIVVVESVLPGTQTPSHHGWDAMVTGRGYQFVHFDGLNRYYLADSHRDLTERFRSGPNVFDEFVLSGTSTSRFSRLLLNRAAELGDKIARQAEAMAYQAETHAAELKRQAEAHAAEIEHRAKIHAAEIEHQATTHAAEIEHQATTHAAERAEDQWRLDTMLGERDHARFEADTFRQALDELHARHSAAARGAQAEIASQQQEIARLHDAIQTQAAHYAAELYAVNIRLAGTLGSTSWKVTRPLRLAGRIVKRLIRDLRAAPARLTLLIRRLPAAGIAALRARPGLKRAVVALLDRFPGLAARARRYVNQRPGPTITAPPIPRPAESGGAHLSASARRIHARLAASRSAGRNTP